MLTPSRGIVTLFGYGISVRVDRGHLIVEDGIGTARRRARFARVGHGLRRLVVIGFDGSVSLAALRWLADQDAAFVMLDRTGKVLLATGPVGTRDARLRRAQALAVQSGIAVPIARELVARKLIEQERIARDTLGDASVAEVIKVARAGISSAATIPAIRACEAQAAAAYWSLWHALPVIFPTKDLPRVPQHWRTVGARCSPLTGSPRLAVTPPGSILNYLYSILESEARLAAAALGLDPGLGVMHADMNVRDSLACDLMEPIRPQCDQYVLEILRHPLRREWFFEERDGTCRLMAPFAEQLSETAPSWARAVAPIAERVAKALWASSRGGRRAWRPPTPLTQAHRREGRGVSPNPPNAIATPQRPPNLCRSCGSAIRADQTVCGECNASTATERMRRVAVQGRIVAQRPEAQARRAATQRANARAQHKWNAADQPPWLTEQFYALQIQPRLSGVKRAAIMAALRVSRSYAASIRTGRRRPHPRHWLTLATLLGTSGIA
jgi:CRISPR-associated endonuclease Cas1